jgi:hypothetical protein
MEKTEEEGGRNKEHRRFYCTEAGLRRIVHDTGTFFGR